MSELLTAVIGLIVLGLLLTDRVRIDLIALTLPVVLTVLTLITPTQALDGFSRPAVIILIGLFILSRGLERTGVVARIADWIVARSHGSEPRLVLFLMGSAAALSLFMNNVAAGAIILPAAISAADRTGIAPSRLLMPVSFGSLLGGMATLFTTANIVSSSVLRDRGLTGLNMLSFLPTGSLMLMAGMIYIMLIGRHLLPHRPARTDLAAVVVASVASIPVAQPENSQRAGTAVVITIVTLLSSIVLDSVYLPVAVLAGAVAMVITGCLDLDDGYRAVDWRTIFLVAGMTALSTAIVDTGLAERLGNAVISALGASGTLAIYAGLYLLTVGLAQVMSGQVTALVVAPIAISTALSLNASPQAACVVVAVGCSTCFLLPNAHPVNMLMLNAGGYRTRDFWRIGLGLTAVCFVALIVALRLFWGL